MRNSCGCDRPHIALETTCAHLPKQTPSGEEGDHLGGWLLPGDDRVLRGLPGESAQVQGARERATVNRHNQNTSLEANLLLAFPLSAAQPFQAAARIVCQTPSASEMRLTGRGASSVAFHHTPPTVPRKLLPPKHLPVRDRVPVHSERRRGLEAQHHSEADPPGDPGEQSRPKNCGGERILFLPCFAQRTMRRGRGKRTERKGMRSAADVKLSCGHCPRFAERFSTRKHVSSLLTRRHYGGRRFKPCRTCSTARTRCRRRSRTVS